MHTLGKPPFRNQGVPGQDDIFFTTILYFFLSVVAIFIFFRILRALLARLSSRFREFRASGAVISISSSNPRNESSSEARLASARPITTSNASTFTTSQPQRPGRTVCTSQSSRPPTTLHVPRINNHNRVSNTSRLQQRNIPQSNDSSQPTRQQAQPRASAQSSRENQRNSPRTSHSPISSTSPSTNESSHLNRLRTRNRNPSFSVDELYSFYVTAKFEEESCPICLEALQKELVSTGNCLHLAHASCLKQWLVRDTLTACPICRVPIANNSSEQTRTRIAHMVLRRPRRVLEV